MKQMQKLVVVDNDGVAFCVQPEKPISDVAKMVAWCRDNVKMPGVYRLIREVPGELVVEEVKSVSVRFQ